MSGLTHGNCVLVLIDESAGMNVVMGEVVSDGMASKKTNLERVATAVNAWLSQLSRGNELDVSLVGYHADVAGQASVGPRWGGALAGRDWVSTGELEVNPLRMENRSRKIPDPSGMGVAREEVVRFPVWYEPTPGGKAPQIAAYAYCRELLAKRGGAAGETGGAALIVHISAGASGDGNPQLEVLKLLDAKSPSGPPLLFQIHVAASANLATSLFPSNAMFLTSPTARDLFQRASPLPEAMLKKLKQDGVAVNAGARAMIYGAKLVDVTRALALVRDYAQTLSPPSAQSTVGQVSAPNPTPVHSEAVAAVEAGYGLAAETTTTEATPSALAVVILDRAVESPYAGDTTNVFTRLQDQANELLQQLSKTKLNGIDVAALSYGVDSTGQSDIRIPFEGGLRDKRIVKSPELGDGVLRVEEYEEQVSNGVGGLLNITRKKFVYFDLEPTVAAECGEVMRTAAGIVQEWFKDHADSTVGAVILHLTRGRFDATQTNAALQTLRAAAPAGKLRLYHVIATEYPHPSAAYPADDTLLEHDELKSLFACSDVLQNAAELSAEFPHLMPESKGIVINGKFDLLFASLGKRLPTT